MLNLQLNVEGAILCGVSFCAGIAWILIDVAAKRRFFGENAPTHHLSAMQVDGVQVEKIGFLNRLGFAHPR